MSRLFRFLLLLAGAGALVAVVRHISRRSAEQQPFFADGYQAPAPFVTPEPVVTEAVVVPEPVVAEEPVVAGARRDLGVRR